MSGNLIGFAPKSVGIVIDRQYHGREWLHWRAVMLYDYGHEDIHGRTVKSFVDFGLDDHGCEDVHGRAVKFSAVLDRGEKIELLVDKTESLQFQADSFQRQGRQLRRKMWLQNLRFKLMVAGGVLALLLVLWLMACRGFKC